MAKIVTFKGSPRMAHYSGSLPGLAPVFLPGDKRELSDDVATYLLESFPGVFSVEGAARSEAVKSAPPRAIKSTGNTSPPTIKKGSSNSKKKGSKR